MKISAQDLDDHVAEHGALTPNGFLIFNFGWAQFFWTEQDRYVNNQPCLDDSAVEWILDRIGNQLGVGVDGLSPECNDNTNMM